MSTGVPYSLEELRSRIAGLEQQLRALLEARSEAVQGFFAQKQEAEEAIRKADDQWTAEWDAERKRHEERFTQERQRIVQESSRELERVWKAHGNVSARVKEDLSKQVAQIREGERRKTEHIVSKLKQKYAPLYDHSSDLSARIDALRAKTQKLGNRVGEFAASLRIPIPEPTREKIEPVAREEIVDAVERSLSENEELLETIQKELWLRFVRSRPLLTMGIVDLLAHGGALAAVRILKPDWFQIGAIAAAVTLVCTLLVIVAFYRGLRHRARAVVHMLHGKITRTLSILRPHVAALKKSAERIGERLLDEQMKVAENIKGEFGATVEDSKKSAKAWLNQLQNRRDGLTQRVRTKYDEKLKQAEARLKEVTSIERYEAELRHRRARGAGGLEQIVAREKKEMARLAHAWKHAIDEARRMAAEACGRSLERHPSWSDPRWQDPVLPSEFPDGVYVGDVRIDPAGLAGPDVELLSPQGDEMLTLPLALSFPNRGSLFMSMDPERRDRALEGLFSTVLRILTSFPPGKAEFRIFDPVGLGQSFSALMHLADYDESLVGGRIWTEPVHFERKLAELTEHIEKVIQKYLRNRYASIDEYNREVGQMAEAYRFVVVADFPSGFSELAFDRLTSIITSGPRCGVYTLILRDRKQKLPRTMDMAGIRRNAVAIETKDDGFAVEDAQIKQAHLTIEKPPASEALTALMHSIGRQCAEAESVALEFDLTAPRPEELWSLSSESGVRIPLGKAGADRLQHLDLGKGTAQHALIAGKTGSGKSTLFHVMITNAALWYGPQELELYLIDYKKGVEFKRFAAHGLPHIRVVAIETDREFGLSVLRRLDRELAIRAELFRKNGVQDFESYRKSKEANHLPRTLLLIDEFQEFFVEEDAIAQEAALLLDRVVRQGRAFGVHVVLGSQTLGGSYTLASTTLGQMGVRIALQCNEADSYLILSDDNAAARLLSRPGEAIYNDMQGRVEGNNPFQVVWLPEEVEERHLRRVAERAAREKWKPREPMTVFEGNVPADIRKNVLLNERLARPFAEAGKGAVPVWLGEANEIKGRTEIRFKDQGGSNLLIVGQQKESALTVMLASMASLAAAHPPGAIRFVILDGSPGDFEHGRRLAELAEAIPHDVEIVRHDRVAEVMTELGAEVAGRLEGTRKSEARVFLIVYDLPRFRKLRQGDDFDFSSGDDDAPSPDRCFADVLTEGPALGVHSIVWCDSLNNLNRTLNRKTLRQFEMRVLFQMSGTDSSELIDTPLAGKLGLYRGLLVREEDGSMEKFRPYAVPDADWVERVGKSLAAARAPRE